jgi:hypothetical protein
MVKMSKDHIFRESYHRLGKHVTIFCLFIYFDLNVSSFKNSLFRTNSEQHK